MTENDDRNKHNSDEQSEKSKRVNEQLNKEKSADPKSDPEEERDTSMDTKVVEDKSDHSLAAYVEPEYRDNPDAQTQKMKTAQHTASHDEKNVKNVKNEENEKNEEHEENEENVKKRRKRLPLGLRILLRILRFFLVPLLCLVALYVGLRIGYVIVGGQDPADIWNMDTWKHLIDLIFKD